MFTYNIGYGSYEESEYTYLMHEKKYTFEEFRDMIEQCAVEVITQGLAKQEPEYIHNYQDIHTDVVKLLITKYGFKQLITTVEWTVFGWASMFTTTKDWKDARDANLDHLTNTIRKAGFTEKSDGFLSDHSDNE
jgi:alpha-amylase/alpha-mannosidase (GH57 family)